MFPDTGTCSATLPSGCNVPWCGFGTYQLVLSLIIPRHDIEVLQGPFPEGLLHVVALVWRLGKPTRGALPTGCSVWEAHAICWYRVMCVMHWKTMGPVCFPVSLMQNRNNPTEKKLLIFAKSENKVKSQIQIMIPNSVSNELCFPAIMCTVWLWSNFQHYAVLTKFDPIGNILYKVYLK